MKQFIKMSLATIVGLLVFSIVAMFLSFGIIGAIASMGEKQPVMPKEAVLSIDMSNFILSEQTQILLQVFRVAERQQRLWASTVL